MQVFKVIDKKTSIVIREYYESEGANRALVKSDFASSKGWIVESMNEQEYVNACVDRINAILNGQTMCIAKHQEFWMRLRNGASVAVYEVEGFDGELPFRYMTVRDYEGRTYDLAQDFTPRSVTELYSIIDILF